METTGLIESVDQPTAHSENARIIERYTPSFRDGLRRMKVEVTIHDPAFYTAPPTLTREYTHLPVGGTVYKLSGSGKLIFIQTTNATEVQLRCLGILIKTHFSNNVCD